jgi:hypothetical protein
MVDLRVQSAVNAIGLHYLHLFFYRSSLDWTLTYCIHLPFVSYFPLDISSRGLWCVSHTAPLASALPCCSYPPSGCHGAITSRRPVVRTAVKYRRLATGRLYGTSLPCRHFLTSSPVQFLPSCTHKTGERERKGKIFIRMSH